MLDTTMLGAIINDKTQTQTVAELFNNQTNIIISNAYNVVNKSFAIHHKTADYSYKMLIFFPSTPFYVDNSTVFSICRGKFYAFSDYSFFSAYFL